MEILEFWNFFSSFLMRASCKSKRCRKFVTVSGIDKNLLFKNHKNSLKLEISAKISSKLICFWTFYHKLCQRKVNHCVSYASPRLRKIKKIIIYILCVFLSTHIIWAYGTQIIRKTTKILRFRGGLSKMYQRGSFENFSIFYWRVSCPTWLLKVWILIFRIG